MIESTEFKTIRPDLWKGKGTILIVDDEVPICRVLKELLNSKGFDTHSASSAAAGLEILNKIKVDIVITNIWMPGMNGIELTRLIKGKYNSDVIIMTGYHSFKYEEAIRIGASDLLHKPVTLEDLLKSINKILNK